MRQDENVRDDQTRIFVVKVASRCNLACTYCYMYFHPDQTWSSQPKFMSAITIANIAERLRKHVDNLTDGEIMVVVHGGEPLLYPHLDFFFSEMKRIIKRVAFAIQTNGTLLSPETAKILNKYEVRIGVSLDGNKESHNKTRLTHSGHGSYDDVMNGIKIAKSEAGELLDSILQVIDVSIPPDEMLKTLESLDISRSDLLFPDLNHDTMKQSDISPGVIGKWLIKVFDLWIKREATVHIRVFLTIIELLLGSESGTDLLGAKSSGVLMIETDGTYEIHDGLKTAFTGAGKTGLSVLDTDVSVIENIPLAKSFRDKASAANISCLNCNLFKICGGGSPIHRYSSKNQFDNPSVFCEDLMLIINHIKISLKLYNPNLELAC